MYIDIEPGTMLASNFLLTFLLDQNDENNIIRKFQIHVCFTLLKVERLHLRSKGYNFHSFQ